jgi:DNA-binding response OmpR family regulator
MTLMCPIDFIAAIWRIDIMSENTLRLLIAEREYLIAIDASDILGTEWPGAVTVCSPADLADRLADSAWDVVLIDVGSDDEALRRDAERVLAAGVGIVFLTGHMDQAKGVAGFERWPVVIKPFTETLLITAVRQALATAGKA